VGARSLTEPDNTDIALGDYEVAIAVAPDFRSSQEGARREENDRTEPGFDETSWRPQWHYAAGRSSLLAKGDAAVKFATEAIARQIGVAAQRIAETIEAQTVTPANPGALSLDSIEVSFGVTLTAGVEALFTVKSESSAEVTIILSRRPAE
jgi:hypothetical protein